MAKLCQDTVLNIVIRLQVKSILRFRCVSKSWCKLLKDPDFVKKHLNHAIEMNKFSLMMHPFADFHKDTYTVAYDHSSSTLSNCVDISYPRGGYFWGTCNGLVCLTTTCENYIVLWNPATKEFKEVSVPSRPHNRFSYAKYGFGYDDKIDDFKVVSFLGIQEKAHCEVQVYTLKSNSWRRLETIPYDFYYPGQVDIAQLSVNGVMHWLAETDSGPFNVIVSFDFKDEKFDKMSLPSCKYGFGNTNLCSLGGSLCLHGSISWRSVIDVWEMKEYGVAESWVKLFTFSQTTICQFRHLVPLQVVKNGQLLLGYDTDVGFHLDLYDLKCGTSINLKTHATRIWYSETTFVYVESLVSLNSGTYVELPGIEDPKASARSIDLDNLNSGTHVGGGNSEDEDGSEEGEEEGEEEEYEIAEGSPASPKSDYETRETSPRQSCETLDRYNHYVEKYMDLKRRKLDLETRKLDFNISVQENQHMRMDTSKMNALQLKWWQMRANQIAEKCGVSDMSPGDVNDDKEEDKDRNDVEQEEAVKNSKKKAKTV